MSVWRNGGMMAPPPDDDDDAEGQAGNEGPAVHPQPLHADDDLDECPNEQHAADRKGHGFVTKVRVGMVIRRWSVVSRIGAGSFGETFGGVEVDSGVDGTDALTNKMVRDEEDEDDPGSPLVQGTKPQSSPSTGREVCIKVEQESKNVLRLEVLALKKAQPCPQVVRYVGSGRFSDANYLVMERLGPNLVELRRSTLRGVFSIFTMLQVGISCLRAIKGVHELGLIHRDIKPSNFVVGRDPNSDGKCYLIDFGLARRYRRSNGEVRPPRDDAGFRGTSRYASLRSHQHLDLGRVDDLWSLLFMLVEFATGTLPWRKYKEKEDIGRCKEETIGPSLVKNLPREFGAFLDHLQSVGYGGQPRYDFLISLLQHALDRRGYPPDKLLDWQDPAMRQHEPGQPAPGSLPTIVPVQQKEEIDVHREEARQFAEEKGNAFEITLPQRGSTPPPPEKSFANTAQAVTRGDGKSPSKGQQELQSQQQVEEHAVDDAIPPAPQEDMEMPISVPAHLPDDSEPPAAGPQQHSPASHRIVVEVPTLITVVPQEGVFMDSSVSDAEVLVVPNDQQPDERDDDDEADERTPAPLAMYAPAPLVIQSHAPPLERSDLESPFPDLEDGSVWMSVRQRRSAGAHNGADDEDPFPQLSRSGHAGGGSGKVSVLQLDQLSMRLSPSAARNGEVASQSPPSFQVPKSFTRQLAPAAEDIRHSNVFSPRDESFDGAVVVPVALVPTRRVPTKPASHNQLPPTAVIAEVPKEAMPNPMPPLQQRYPLDGLHEAPAHLNGAVVKRSTTADRGPAPKDKEDTACSCSVM